MRACDAGVHGLRIHRERRRPAWRRRRKEVRARLPWPSRGSGEAGLPARDGRLRPQIREREWNDVSFVHRLLSCGGRPTLLSPGAESLRFVPLTPWSQAASAALAFSAIAWNAAGSWMARSDSTLRSTVMPDLDRPLIKTL